MRGTWLLLGSYQRPQFSGLFSGAVRLPPKPTRTIVEPDPNQGRSWYEADPNLSRRPVEQQSKRTRSGPEGIVNFPEELRRKNAFFRRFPEQNIFFPEETRRKRIVSF